MNSKVVVSCEITKQRSEQEAEGIEKPTEFSSNNGQLRTINISYQKGDCAGNTPARSRANMKKTVVYVQYTYQICLFLRTWRRQAHMSHSLTTTKTKNVQ